MKVTYITNACVLIEHKGKRVLCDPWLTDGIYYGSWFHYPELKEDTIDRYKDVDYLYISHIHPDHYDEATLKHFDKKIPVFICEYEEKYFYYRLKALGFETVTEVPNGTVCDLGDGLKMEIRAGDDANPVIFSCVYRCPVFNPTGKTRQIDSLAIFSTDDGQVVVNTNDVPWQMIHQYAPQIVSKYGHVDLLLTAYSGAGPYPQAYDLPDDVKRENAVRTAYGYARQVIELVRMFRPRFWTPFAGGYVLGGRLHGLNEFKGVLDIDDVADDIEPQIRERCIGPKMVMLDPGGSIETVTGDVTGAFTPTDFAARRAYIRSLANAPYVYDDIPPIKEKEFVEKMNQAMARLKSKQMAFRYWSPWRVFINHPCWSDLFVAIPFNGDDWSVVEKPTGDLRLIAGIDPRLFSMILRREANWNNAEIGSHIKLNLTHGDKTIYEAMVFFLMPYFQGDRIKETANV